MQRNRKRTWSDPGCKYPLFVLIAFCNFLWPAGSPAQSVANPMFTDTHNEVTIAIGGGASKEKTGDLTVYNNEYLVRTVVGLGRRFDIYAEFGFSKLAVDLTGATASHLDGDFKPAYGGGLTLRLFTVRKWRLSLFSGAQVFRFTANPTTSETVFLADNPARRQLQLKYDWRTYQFNMGVTKELGELSFVVGVSGRFVQRVEKKVNKLALADGGFSETSTKGEYLSGVQFVPFAGMNLHLPSRLKLNFELKAQDIENIAFFAGISQTGKP